MPTAYAEELKVTTSPLIVEIATKIATQPEVAALKQQGCLGKRTAACGITRLCGHAGCGSRMRPRRSLPRKQGPDGAVQRDCAAERDMPDMNVAKVQAIYALERLNRAARANCSNCPRQDRPSTRSKVLRWAPNRRPVQTGRVDHHSVTVAFETGAVTRQVRAPGRPPPRQAGPRRRRSGKGAFRRLPSPPAVQKRPERGIKKHHDHQ